MTSKTWYLLTLVVAGFAAHAAELEYPFDPTLKKIEDQIDVESKKCLEIKNPMAGMQCSQDVRDRAKQKADRRGTRPYAELTYKKLPTPELEAARLAVMKQQETAREIRDFSRSNPRPNGELTKEALGVELGVIEDELVRRGRTRDEENIEKWKTLTGKEPRQ